jgi:hypothetical protein
MPDALKPGGMGAVGSDLNAMPTDFAGSMAAEIEDALHRLLGDDGIHAFDQDTNSSDARDRRRLLVAIAQGVVGHIVRHVGAIQVSVVDEFGNTLTGNVTISTDPAILPGA